MKLACSEVEGLFGDTLSWIEILRGGPPWLDGALLRTGFGRQRLRRWIELGCPSANGEEVPYFGDRGTGERVIAALKRIAAPPLVHFAVEHAAVVGIGTDAVGVASGYALDFGPRVLIAVAGGRDDEDVETTVAHEIAHLWLHCASADDLEPSPPRPPVSRVEYEELVSRGDTMHRAWEEGRDAREEQVSTLVHAWGFTGHRDYHNNRRKR